MELGENFVFLLSMLAVTTGYDSKISKTNIELVWKLNRTFVEGNFNHMKSMCAVCACSNRKGMCNICYFKLLIYNEKNKIMHTLTSHFMDRSHHHYHCHLKAHFLLVL